MNLFDKFRGFRVVYTYSVHSRIYFNMNFGFCIHSPGAIRKSFADIEFAYCLGYVISDYRLRLVRKDAEEIQNRVSKVRLAQANGFINRRHSKHISLVRYRPRNLQCAMSISICLYDSDYFAIANFAFDSV